MKLVNQTERTKKKVWDTFQLRVKCSDIKKWLEREKLNSRKRRNFSKMIERLEETILRLEREVGSLENFAHVQAAFKNRNKQIILEPRRSTRVSESTFCKNCHSIGNGFLRYAVSNRGPVILCRRCKSTVYDRSFGTFDAMGVAIQGGQFESNRRRQ